MATSSNYIWYFDLAEYLIDDSSNQSYYAKVKIPNSLSVSDIAAAIANERTDLRQQTIETVVKLFNEKAMQMVCKGSIVNTGLAVLKPSIRGKFTDKNGTVTDNHTPNIVINPVRSLREEVSEVKLKFSGNVLDTGGAIIGSITTNDSDELLGTIVPGSFVILQGRHIKCTDDTGQGYGSISFVSKTNGEMYNVESFVYNGMNKVIVLVPPTLPSDTYKLVLTTYYSRSGTPLKNARMLEYFKDLIVD